MRDREMRDSLGAVGALLPVLEHAGARIDGRRRAQICLELGIPIASRVCHSLGEACAALWPHHPARALELAGARPLLELAKLCGTSPTAIALELQRLKPKPKHIRRTLGEQDGPGVTKTRPHTKAGRGSKGCKLELWVEPAFKAYIDECAKVERLSLSGLIRDALWSRIALKVPRAPLHPPSGKEKRKAS
jgi:hypothetical protein